MGPRASIAFGSCTASSPGPRALGAVEKGLHQWSEQGDSAWTDSCNGTKSTLRRVLGIGPEVAIALTPSGTDVLYLVSHIARRGVSQVHHIVTGASELGGGTVRACMGHTFSTRTPHGGAEEPDQPIEGLEHLCSAQPFYLREASGYRLDGDEIDDEIEQQVSDQIAPDRRVVLHMVVHSKTGLRAPSADAAVRLRNQFSDRLMILVDAAQGRLAPADIRRALNAGFAVIFTGSKFYSGPPFSGALLLPKQWAGDPGPLPEALSKWFDRDSMPEHWTAATASITQQHNPGLALRWAAAEAEFDAYHQIPPRWRGRVYATFAGAVHETFGPSEHLDLEYPLPPVHRLVTALGAFPTVFGFRIRDQNAWLQADALREVHRLLDTDLSQHDPRLGGCFHLGQPVALGPPGDERRALLRIALGGRLVTDFARTSDAGGKWMRAQMFAIRNKIETLISLGMVP